MVIPLHLAPMRRYHKNCIELCHPSMQERHCQNKVSLAESHQDAKGLGQPPCKGSLMDGAASTWRRNGFGGTQSRSPLPQWAGHWEDGAGLFTGVQGSRTRDGGHKLIWKSSDWREKEKVRAEQQWNRLPQDVEHSPSLETQLGKAQSNQVWPLHWPCLGQRCDRGPPEILQDLLCCQSKDR